MGAEEHRKQAEDQGSVALAIVTVSDTHAGDGRQRQADPRLAEATVTSVAGYRIVKDEPGEVAQALEDFAGRRRRSCSTAEPASAAAIAPTTISRFLKRN